jgi:prevent-host-death family protein
MPRVGIRELKARASEIVRRVHEERARYVITYRGRPVGVLMPLSEVPDAEAGTGEAWDELARLGEEIGRGWRSSLTSDEILAEIRR